jgi:hypothetical protein
MSLKEFEQRMAEKREAEKRELEIKQAAEKKREEERAAAQASNLSSDYLKRTKRTEMLP